MPRTAAATSVITHDIMSARRVADYIAVLWKGRIVESWPPRRSCSNSDNQFVRQFLSGEGPWPARNGSSAQFDSSRARGLILATRRGGTRTLFAATATGCRCGVRVS